MDTSPLPNTVDGVLVEDMKVIELRKEMKKRGLSSSGLKKELQDRLNQHLSKQQRAQADLNPEPNSKITKDVKDNVKTVLFNQSAGSDKKGIKKDGKPVEIKQLATDSKVSFENDALDLNADLVEGVGENVTDVIGAETGKENEVKETTASKDDTLNANLEVNRKGNEPNITKADILEAQQVTTEMTKEEETKEAKAREEEETPKDNVEAKKIETVENKEKTEEVQVEIKVEKDELTKGDSGKPKELPEANVEETKAVEVEVVKGSAPSETPGEEKSEIVEAKESEEKASEDAMEIVEPEIDILEDQPEDNSSLKTNQKRPREQEDMSKDSQSIEAPAAKRAFGKAASQPIKEEQPLPEISEGKTKVPPTTGPISNSIRVDNLVRPFMTKSLQELLGQSGKVEKFWIDAIKTHCYATFSSTEEAESARNALLDLVWPEFAGKKLSVNFVPEEEVDSKLNSSNTVKPVQDLKAVPPPPLPAKERRPEPVPSKKRERPETGIFDGFFKKTLSKPVIYFLPLSDKEVAAKLQNVSKAPVAAKV